ncbi:MAG TPA: oxidoreductase, partial [Saprospiraceae bacterium]|nr:oxidoreductase [Saprospiraceae bacterium]
NADLRHVDVVLCADPKVFLHTDALQGLKKGGAFVWESNEENPADAWNYIPVKYRHEIIEKDIKVYILNGFKIAKAATEREELQTRMQGNAFLGAFFRVSSFLKDYNIPKKEFEETIHAQYVKKFGRFGDDVVNSNMTVMKAGFDDVKEVPIGKLDAPDASNFVGNVISPCGIDIIAPPRDKEGKSPIHTLSAFDAEFRAGYGYNQPASPLASVGYIASGTGDTASKYVARRAIPMFIEENCTQCMECISACPDTAMPNTAQDISQILTTAFKYYVSDGFARNALLEHLDDLDKKLRADMYAYATDKELKKNPDDRVKFKNILRKHLEDLKSDVIDDKAINQVLSIVETLPLAYMSARGIFAGKEKKEAGDGGIFSIFINDKCKGCGECVDVCGDHEALVMIVEDEDWHARVKSSEGFFKLLPETPKKYLGIYNPDDPYEAKAAALKNHLMQQSKYNALVSGDGACAGCGEKTILHAVASVTEAVMRPLFFAKAERLTEKVAQLKRTGLMKLEALKANDLDAYNVFTRTVLHIIMGYGAENAKATEKRIADGFDGGDAEIIDGLVAVLSQEAYNHKELQTLEGHMPNGMSAMAMTANTGCNTVYGSTPPNNPHPYPWMNSLFQDGTTIGWIVGESFIRDHAAHAVIPERLVDTLLGEFEKGFDEDDYFYYTHFSDKFMTDKEVLELPKVWAIGGDGGIGDIGFQNLSKVVLQNRPNVKVLMLDTQVYSNTGGQNSDSSVMTGGFDMNQIGPATEGKMTEKKSVAEIMMSGHGSPYVAQVSAASIGVLFRALIDGLHYRGTAYYQAFTTCQPEHGVPDDASEAQAIRVRDSRGMPEFVFDPGKGETFPEALYIKGNPNYQNDWYTKRSKGTKERFTYTVAHWALTEARFRRHHKKVSADKVEGKQELLSVLQNVTMQDIVHHRYLDKNHRSYIPDWEVYLVDHTDDGQVNHHLLSRQMVIFCVERRKAWRMLQSKAGIENKDYLAQKEYLKGLDA